MRTTIALATGIAALAAAPAQAKDPPGVNPTHFLCYRVLQSTALKPTAVKLKDQFGAFGTKIGRPLFLCTPVSKNGEPVKDERTHLTCYQISAKNAARKVRVVNQFGSQILAVGGSVALCVPSLKDVQK